jgi:hypothetical protein
LDEASESVVDTGHSVSNNKAMEASITSKSSLKNKNKITSKSYPEPSAPVISKSSNEFPFRYSYLSNRERLLLRKQALTMKKRPVFAIGIIFRSIFFFAILQVLLYLQFLLVYLLSLCNFDESLFCSILCSLLYFVGLCNNCINHGLFY